MIYTKGDRLIGCHEENEGVLATYDGMSYGSHRIIVKYDAKVIGMSRIRYEQKPNNVVITWSCYSPMVIKKFWKKNIFTKIDKNGNLN